MTSLLTKPLRKLFGQTAKAEPPAFGLSPETSQLCRPEAVDFTTSGDLMAVANSEGNSVTLYEKGGSFYKETPCCELSSTDHLWYVHDLAFSPCNQLLATAARDAHTVALFRRCTDNPTQFEADPFWTIKGQAAGLGFPTGVAIDPSGQWLVVCNRMGGTGLTLYRKLADGSGAFESEPTYHVSEDAFFEHGLAAPHGLAFSGDGRSVMITHKRFGMTSNPRGQSGVSVLGWKGEVDQGLDPNPLLALLQKKACLHSVAFHPDSKHVAATNEKEDVQVFTWANNKLSKRSVQTVVIDKKGGHEGPKGIQFTSDGKYIVITTATSEVLFYPFLAQ